MEGSRVSKCTPEALLIYIYINIYIYWVYIYIYIFKAAPSKAARVGGLLTKGLRRRRGAQGRPQSGPGEGGKGGGEYQLGRKSRIEDKTQNARESLTEAYRRKPQRTE